MNLNVVWLKRDLRLRDHAPLFHATQYDGEVLLLYIVEPKQLADPHLDIRHWRFIWQSLTDLNEQLAEFNGQLSIAKGNVTDILACLLKKCDTFRLFSSVEVGVESTFARDRDVARWCTKQSIAWREFDTGAVLRALPNRANWDKHWHKVMRAPAFDTDLEKVRWNSDQHLTRFKFEAPKSWQKTAPRFQPGGEKRAWFTLHDFFKIRGKNYAINISRPAAARKACSRMSPYLAWGNISLKQIYQTTLSHWHDKGWRRSLVAFTSRLHWHCHFIQKFESECEMEFRPVNHGYQHFQFDETPESNAKLIAWQRGQTGYPLVDACMRCLHATGYINFRMRSMLVSFLVHHLNIDWRRGVRHLARMFLDFEPGIHYPQFQMQAGVTGANMIRIYNPVKQSLEHDPDGEFIKKWVPELARLPTEILHSPCQITPLEQQIYQFFPGRDYPLPLIDIEISYKEAQERLWSFRNRDDVKVEAERILQRHTIPSTRHKYRRG